MRGIRPKAFLGLDVGSVSTNIILLDEGEDVVYELYLRTQGRPLEAIQAGIAKAAEAAKNYEIVGVGTTGSGRQLAGVMVGADVVKNEITAHAVAAAQRVPDVQTVIEIGGQDSKIIILRQGVVVDFAMNTVCAAGTGSFLDQQASRLGIKIEEFGALALQAENPVRIAGRCSVFAESDMIHKQQMGHRTVDIIAGLCAALVRNYLNNVAKGKELLAPVVFQGGVAANAGIKAAFEQELNLPIIIPPYYHVMGALGAALLAKEEMSRSRQATNFRGFALAEQAWGSSSFECRGCPNQCEVINIHLNGAVAARWGDRCGKWTEAQAEPLKA